MSEPASRMPRLLARLLPRLSGRRGPLLLACIPVLLFAVSIGGGLTLDDYIQRGIVLETPGMEQLIPRGSAMFSFATGDLALNQKGIERGFLPWWSAPNIRLNFWRPLTELTHRADYALWPEQPWLMHVQNLLWLGLLAGVVALLYRRLHGATSVAALAGLLYAIDDTHNWGAAWLADRNGVMAALFGACSLYLHDRWRRDGARWAGLLSVLLVLPGLLAGEAFVASCGYLLAYALVLDRATLRSRLLSLVPVTTLVISWYIRYRALGHGSIGSGIYRDPASDPLLFLQALPGRLMLLLGSQFAFGGPEFSELVGPEVLLPATLLHVALFAGFSWLMWPRLRVDVVARFWYVGMVVSALPFCAVIPMERNLLIPGIGAMGCLASFLVHYWQAGSPSRLVRGLAGFTVVMSLVLSPILAPIKAYALPALTTFVGMCGESVLHLSDVENRHLIMLDAPDACASYATVLPIVQGSRVPLTVRTLASGLNDSRVTRIDDNTLRLTVEHGWFWAGIELMFANGRHRYRVGEEVALPELTIRIAEVTTSGKPLAIDVLFARGLSSGRYLLLRTQGGWQVPVEPPAVGESLLLPGKLVPIGRPAGGYPGLLQ